MITDGDRVLICLSGGKDSLSLLHTIHQYQFYAKSKGVNFQLGAVTVDPGSDTYDPSPLISYLKTLEVPYFYEEQSNLKLFVPKFKPSSSRIFEVRWPPLVLNLYCCNNAIYEPVTAILLHKCGMSWACQNYVLILFSCFRNLR